MEGEGWEPRGSSSGWDDGEDIGGVGGKGSKGEGLGEVVFRVGGLGRWGIGGRGGPHVSGGYKGSRSSVCQ